jgi:hypothetical protein
VPVPRIVVAVSWCGPLLGACALPHANVPRDGTVAPSSSDAGDTPTGDRDERDDVDDGAIADEGPGPEAGIEGRDVSEPGMDAVARDGGEDARTEDASGAGADGGGDGAAPCVGPTADCGDGRCRPILGRVLTCAEAEVDGVHVLSLGGTPFCGYCRSIGTGPRWTLVMKVDGAITGRPQRFAYDAALWTNGETYAPHEVEPGGRELKSLGFSVLPVRELLVEITGTGPVRSLTGRLAADGAAPTLTLRGLFSGGENAFGALWTADQWTGAVQNSRLQARCIRAGVNVRASRAASARVRLGAIANNDIIECDSHDSWVGVGGYKENAGSISAGNFADFNGANDRNFGVFASLWVR